MKGSEEFTPAKPPSEFPPNRPSLGRPSPSFRLRSPSLNAVRLRRIFDIFDYNHDGEITIEELCLALDRLGLGGDPEEVSSIVKAHILPGRSGLGFLDFEGLHRTLGESLFGSSPEGENEERDPADAVEAEETDMKEAFRVFDEDGDGYISAEELQMVLEKLGLPEARNISSVSQMICSVDRNQDGRVDFIEFKHMMQGISVMGS